MYNLPSHHNRVFDPSMEKPMSVAANLEAIIASLQEAKSDAEKCDKGQAAALPELRHDHQFLRFLRGHGGFEKAVSRPASSTCRNPI